MHFYTPKYIPRAPCNTVEFYHFY